jgi:hypothetical protein
MQTFLHSTCDNAVNDLLNNLVLDGLILEDLLLKLHLTLLSLELFFCRESYIWKVCIKVLGVFELILDLVLHHLVSQSLHLNSIHIVLLLLGLLFSVYLVLESDETKVIFHFELLLFQHVSSLVFQLFIGLNLSL